MTYLLTIWLIWSAPFDAVLVQYEAPSCLQAIEEVFDEVVNVGVTVYKVVSCDLIQKI